jgi:hypothetical protein
VPTDPDIVIRLRPGRSSVPVDVRLRRALKVLLRSFGLRATSVQELPVVDTPAAVTDAADGPGSHDRQPGRLESRVDRDESPGDGKLDDDPQLHGGL